MITRLLSLLLLLLVLLLLLPLFSSSSFILGETTLQMTGSMFLSNAVINDVNEDYIIEGTLSGNNCQLSITNAIAKNINITGHVLGQNCKITFEDITVRDGSLSFIGNITSTVEVTMTRLNLMNSKTPYAPLFWEPMLDQTELESLSQDADVCKDCKFTLEDSNISRTYDQNDPNIFTTKEMISCANATAYIFASACIHPFGEMNIRRNNISNYGIFEYNGRGISIGSLYPFRNISSLVIEDNEYSGASAAYALNSVFYAGNTAIRVEEASIISIDIVRNSIFIGGTEVGFAIAVVKCNETKTLTVAYNNISQISAVDARGATNLQHFAFALESTNFSFASPSTNNLTISYNNMTMQAKKIYVLRMVYQNLNVEHLEVAYNYFSYYQTQSAGQCHILSGTPTIQNGGDHSGTSFHHNVMEGKFYVFCYAIYVFANKNISNFLVEDNIVLSSSGVARDSSKWNYFIRFQDSNRESYTKTTKINRNNFNSAGGTSFGALVSGEFAKFDHLQINNNTYTLRENFGPLIAQYFKYGSFVLLSANATVFEIQNNYFNCFQDYVFSVFKFVSTEIESDEPAGMAPKIDNFILKNNTFIASGSKGRRVIFWEVDSVTLGNVTCEDNTFLTEGLSLPWSSFIKMSFFAIIEDNNAGPVQFNGKFLMKNNFYSCPNVDHHCQFFSSIKELAITGEVILEGNRFSSNFTNETGNAHFFLMDEEAAINKDKVSSVAAGWRPQISPASAKSAIRLINNVAVMAGNIVSFVTFTKTVVLKEIEITGNDFTGFKNETGWTDDYYSPLVNSSSDADANPVRILRTTIFNNKITSHAERPVGFISESWVSDSFNFSRNTFDFRLHPSDSVAAQTATAILQPFFFQHSTTRINQYQYFKRCKDGCVIADNVVTGNAVLYELLFQVAGNFEGEIAISNNSFEGLLAQNNLKPQNSRLKLNSFSYVQDVDARQIRLTDANAKFIVENSTLPSMLTFEDTTSTTAPPTLAFVSMRYIVRFGVSESKFIVRNNNIKNTLFSNLHSFALLRFVSDVECTATTVANDANTTNSDQIALHKNQIEISGVENRATLLDHEMESGESITLCQNKRIDIADNSLKVSFINNGYDKKRILTLYHQNGNGKLNSISSTTAEDLIFQAVSNELVIQGFNTGGASNLLLEVSFHFFDKEILSSDVDSSVSANKHFVANFENNSISFSPTSRPSLASPSSTTKISSSFILFSNKTTYWNPYRNSHLTFEGNTLSTVRKTNLPSIASLSESQIDSFRKHFVSGSRSNQAFFLSSRENNSNIELSIGPNCNTLSVLSSSSSSPQTLLRVQKRMFAQALPGVKTINSPVCDTLTQSFSRTASETFSENGTTSRSQNTHSFSDPTPSTSRELTISGGTMSLSNSTSETLDTDSHTPSISLIPPIIVLGLDFATKQALETQSQATNSVAAALAAPTAALTGARGVAILSLIGCPSLRNPYDKESKWLESPIPFPQSLVPNVGIGEKRGSYARMAVLGFIAALLFVCGVSIAFGYILEVKRRSEQKKAKIKKQEDKKLARRASRAARSRRGRRGSRQHDDDYDSDDEEMDDDFFMPEALRSQNSMTSNNNRNSPRISARKGSSRRRRPHHHHHHDAMMTDDDDSSTDTSSEEDLEDEKEEDRSMLRGALAQAPYPAFIAIALSQILPYWSISAGMLAGTLSFEDVLLGLLPLLILVFLGGLLTRSVDKTLFSHHGPRVARSLIYRQKDSPQCSQRIVDILLSKVMRFCFIGYYCWLSPRVKHVSRSEIEEVQAEAAAADEEDDDTEISSSSSDDDDEDDFDRYFAPSSSSSRPAHRHQHRNKTGEFAPLETFDEILQQRKDSQELISRMRKTLQKYWGPMTKNELVQLEREARLDLGMRRSSLGNTNNNSNNDRTSPLLSPKAMNSTSSFNSSGRRSSASSSSSGGAGVAINSSKKSMAEEQLEAEEEEISESCLLRTMHSTGCLWKIRARICPHFLFLSSVISMICGVAQGFALSGPEKYCRNSIRTIAFFNCIAAIITTFLRPNIVPLSNVVAVCVEIAMGSASFIAAAFVAEGVGGDDLAATVQIVCVQAAMIGGYIELGIAITRVITLKPFKLEIVPRVEVFRRVRDDLDQVSLVMGSAFGLGMMADALGL